MDKKIQISTASILNSHEITEKENEVDENIGKIFFKKYKVKNKIGKTSLIQIYEGENLTNNTPVIIKLESIKNPELYLELEAMYLFSFKDLGIPKLISTGKTKSYIVLVEEKLGPSLYQLFLKNKKKFSLNEICCIGIQCIERLKTIHSKNYIHRNIKPENFKIGLNDPNVVYLQNFYLCEKFRSDTTKKHAELTMANKIVGTERYGSVNALKGWRQGRKDDLESLCYMLIYFFLGKLPWQDIKAESQSDKYKKLLNKKKKFNIDHYKDIIPEEFRIIFKSIKNLKFDENPKYSFYIRYLQNIREQNGCFDQNDFFWIKKNYKLKKNNIKTKKEGFRERLIEKLNTEAKTEINNADSLLGKYYIDDDLNDDDDNEYNAKTDGHVKLNKSSTDDKNKKSKEEKNEKEDEKENKDVIEDNLNESNSSNSSLDTKIYQLNGPLKNFLKKNNINEDDNIINSNDVIDKSNSNKDGDNNKKLNNTIEENIEEENDVEVEEFNENVVKKEEIQNNKEEEKEVNSINNNNIVINYSSPNTKEGSVSFSNIKESKESKGKERSESPSIIFVKKNSDEINYNKLNKEKRKLVEVKNIENRFGQILGPQFDINLKENKQGKNEKNKDKDCILF